MRRRYIQEQWNEYLTRVMPRDASSIQRIETKRAFYAGAHSILMSIAAAVSPGEEFTDNDEQIMEDLQAEAEEFADDVRKGRA